MTGDAICMLPWRRRIISRSRDLGPWKPSGGNYISYEGYIVNIYPDSKVHEAYVGRTWGRQDPGEPHVGPMDLAIRVGYIDGLV